MNPTEELISFLTRMAVDDDAITIAPRKEAFRPKQRDFLDGIRQCPARISANPGRDPFGRIVRESGQWLFIWIPERD